LLRQQIGLAHPNHPDRVNRITRTFINTGTAIFTQRRINGDTAMVDDHGTPGAYFMAAITGRAKLGINQPLGNECAIFHEQ
jgi:hypothetical protein